MAEYSVELVWCRGTQDFLDNRYRRRHLLRFDGGVEIAASSSPQVVPVPLSDPAAVDPHQRSHCSSKRCATGAKQRTVTVDAVCK
jgi:hypothetical protein